MMNDEKLAIYLFMEDICFIRSDRIGAEQLISFVVNERLVLCLMDLGEVKIYTAVLTNSAHIA